MANAKDLTKLLSIWSGMLETKDRQHWKDYLPTASECMQLYQK